MGVHDSTPASASGSTGCGPRSAERLSEIRRVDIRIDGVETRLESLERTVVMAIDVRERLAALEARRSP